MSQSEWINSINTPNTGSETRRLMEAAFDEGVPVFVVDVPFEMKVIQSDGQTSEVKDILQGLYMEKDGVQHLVLTDHYHNFEDVELHAKKVGEDIAPFGVSIVRSAVMSDINRSRGRALKKHHNDEVISHAQIVGQADPVQAAEEIRRQLLSDEVEKREVYYEMRKLVDLPPYRNPRFDMRFAEIRDKIESGNVTGLALKYGNVALKSGDKKLSRAKEMLRIIQEQCEATPLSRHVIGFSNEDKVKFGTLSFDGINTVELMYRLQLNSRLLKNGYAFDIQYDEDKGKVVLNVLGKGMAPVITATADPFHVSCDVNENDDISLNYNYEELTAQAVVPKSGTWSVSIAGKEVSPEKVPKGLQSVLDSFTEKGAQVPLMIVSGVSVMLYDESGAEYAGAPETDEMNADMDKLIDTLKCNIGYELEDAGVVLDQNERVALTVINDHVAYEHGKTAFMLEFNRLLDSHYKAPMAAFSEYAEKSKYFKSVQVGVSKELETGLKP